MLTSPLRPGPPRRPAPAAALLFAFLLLLGGCGEEERPAPGREGDPVQIRLFPSVRAISPGAAFDVGLEMTPAPGWHLYWKGKSDSGAPIRIVPVLPEGVSAGEVLWPVPERLLSPGGILDHVYYDKVVIVLPLCAAEELPPGEEVRIRLAVDWIACREACVFGAVVHDQPR